MGDGCGCATGLGLGEGWAAGLGLGDALGAGLGLGDGWGTGLGEGDGVVAVVAVRPQALKLQQERISQPVSCNQFNCMARRCWPNSKQGQRTEKQFSPVLQRLDLRGCGGRAQFERIPQAGHGLPRLGSILRHAKRSWTVD